MLLNKETHSSRGKTVSTESMQILRSLTDRLIERDQEIKKRALELDRIYNSCPDMIIVFDDQLIEDCNERACFELGIKRKKLIGRIYTDFIHPDDLASTHKAHGQPEDLVDRTGNFWFTNRWLMADGTYRPVKWSGWLDADGKGIGFGRVVTKEEAARDVKAILAQHLLEYSPVLNCVASLDPPIFEMVSKSWERQLGWTEEELCSQPFTNFVHPDDLEATHEVIHKNDKNQNYVVEGFINHYRCKDGNYKTLLWNTRFLNGKAYGSARIIK